MTDFDNLAACLKQAAKIREESYESHKDYFLSGYKLSIDEAIEKTDYNKQIKTLANLLLFNSWNDALIWADTQIYPAEMAFIEACYSVCNAFGFRDGEDLNDADQNTLSKDFQKAAENMRRSIYGFGVQ